MEDHNENLNSLNVIPSMVDKYAQKEASLQLYPSVLILAPSDLIFSFIS